MKNWVRIKEVYDGGFVEQYLDLYKSGAGFLIKGTSYHYNAGAEKVLCETHIPSTINNTQDIFGFIIDHHSLYSWANISMDDIMSNNNLLAFIADNI